jgi:hypothetical protein
VPTCPKGSDDVHIAASILPDYLAGASGDPWKTRAGAWFYDYDNQGAGASAYWLDAPNAHTTSATTGKNWITNQLMGTADGSTTTFSGTFSQLPIQPGSLILSIGTRASVTAPNNSKKGVSTSILPFIMDDGQGNIIGPPDASGDPPGATGTINYGLASFSQSGAAGSWTVTFTTAPAVGDNPTADFVQLVQTAGAGRCLAIKTASASDGAAVACKSIPAQILSSSVDNSAGIPVVTQFKISGWYKASAAIAAGIRIRVLFGNTQDFAVGAALGSLDIIANGAATTAWQQFSETITVPVESGTTITCPWVRVVAYHNPDGVGGVTVYFDDFSVIPIDNSTMAAGTIVEVNWLPNPSFDFPGVVTSNPASCYRDVLQGSANKLAMPDSGVDLATLEAWWANCNANGRAFNGVMDKASTVFDSLGVIAALGRASFQVRDGLYSVVQDIAQSTIVQHFTPRNSWGFKGTMAFPNLPQALRVRWTNPALNWQPDEVIVYADNPAGGQYSAASVIPGGMLYETLDLTTSVTSITQAWKEGRYHLAQGQQRPATYELSCDIENLVCQRGDLVRVSHDVMGQGLGWGRVKSVQLDGSGNCLSVTLDETSLAMNYGSAYAMRLRRSLDGSSLLYNLVNPATEAAPVSTGAVFYFATPIPAASPQPAAGDLAMFGLQGSESGEYLVTKIEPGKDLSAIITMVDYAPGVFTTDASPPAAMSTQLVAAPQPVAPVIASIYSDDQHSIHSPNGTIRGRVMVGLTPPASSLYAPGEIVAIEYEIRVSSTNGHTNRGAYNSGTSYNTADIVTYGGQTWVSLVSSNVGVTPGTNGADWTLSVETTPWGQPSAVPPGESVLIDNVEMGTVYDIQLRYRFKNGVAGPWSLQAAYTVTGQVTPPGDVSGLAAAVTSKNDVRLTWTKPTSFPGGFEHFEIRTGASWAAGTFLGTTKREDYLITDPGSGSVTYWVGVLDKNGVYDATPQSVTLNFAPQPYAVKTQLGVSPTNDVGPFSSETAVIGPVSFTVPPGGGRIHVDWTVLILNGSTPQVVSAMVQDTTAALECAQHRTNAGAGASHGFNASGHFDHYYPGGAVATIALVVSPEGAAPVTVKASDASGAFSLGAPIVTFLDIQFHPSPN